MDNRGVTTTYTYDALNRLTWKHYSDGVTIAAGFGYDGNDATGHPISGEAYAIGRLSQLTELTAKSISIFSYDSMGRVAKKESCIPTDCNYDIKVNATYNLAGGIKTMTNGSPSKDHPITLTYGYDAANRLDLITSSWAADANHPPTLFQATSTSPASYGPAGLQYALLGVSSTGTPTAIVNRSYDIRMRQVFENDTNSSGTALYSFCISGQPSPQCTSTSSGFALNGNLQEVDDSVMGTWTFENPGYDTLNRLVNGAAASGPYQNQYGCWTYDPFGNRTTEAISVKACNQSPTPTSWADYNSNNQISSTGLMPAGYVYDAAGNVLNDGVNQYLYDGESRICAMKNLTTGDMVQYIYDAAGDRVAKGDITSFSCNLSTNGFTPTSGYVVGLNGEQLTETNGSGGWVHTNVAFANTRLLATYADTNTYFALTDWLGTKRAEATPDGGTSTYASLPFGNGLTATGSLADATEHHFTGNERDSESGNDYFGARYYASTMGRFLSPDWSVEVEPVPYANRDNPQSFNLYSYVGNNPLSRVDADGHFLTLAQERASWGDLDNGSAQDPLDQYDRVQCPGPCSGFDSDGEFVQYKADADAQGYVDLANINEVNSWGGVFLTDTQWQRLLAPYKAEMRAKIAGLLGTTESVLQTGDVKGGNANFTIPTGVAQEYEANHDCQTEGGSTRCNSGSGSLHFEVVSNGTVNVHLDSANPFGHVLGFNPEGLLIHFFVDVVGGEVFMPQGLPH